MTRKDCSHPKDQRSLLYGYDVYCDACRRTVGRVALFPAVVLERAEADAVVEAVGSGEHSRLVRDALARMA